MIVVPYSILSVAFSFIGIRCNTLNPSWYRSFIEIFSSSVLATFLFTHLVVISQNFATYSHYITTTRDIISICIMIVVYSHRKYWTHLYSRLSYELETYSSASTRSEYHFKCRILCIFLLVILIFDLAIDHILDLHQECTSHFLPNIAIGKHEVEVSICIVAYTCLAVIVDGITFYSGVFFAYILIGIDCMYDGINDNLKFSTVPTMRRIGRHGPSGIVKSKTVLMHQIRMDYRRISKLKSDFEKSMSIFPLIWLTGYFVQLYLCLLRSHTYTGPLFVRIFNNWSTFSVTTLLFILIIIQSDRCREKSIKLNRSLTQILLTHSSPSNWNLNLDEILFREDLLRINHVPITVTGIAELRLSIIPIILNVVAPIVVMGYQEINRLPGIIKGFKL